MNYWVDAAKNVTHWKITIEPTTSFWCRHVRSQSFKANAYGFNGAQEVCSTADFYGKTREDAIRNVRKYLCDRLRESDTVIFEASKICP